MKTQVTVYSYGSRTTINVDTVPIKDEFESSCTLFDSKHAYPPPTSQDLTTDNLDELIGNTKISQTPRKMEMAKDSSYRSWQNRSG